MSGNLRLNGTTSGYSELTAPAVAGDQTFTFPAAGGELVVNSSGGGQVVGYQHGQYNANVSAGDYYWVKDGVVLNGDYAYFAYWRIGQVVTINALFRFGGVGDVPEDLTAQPIISLPYNTKSNDSGSPYVSWQGTQIWIGLKDFDASGVQFFSYNFTGGGPVNYVRPAYRTGGSGLLYYLGADKVQPLTQTMVQFTYETDDTTWIPNS